MRKFTVKTLTNFNLLLLTPLFLAVQAQAAEPPRWYGSLDVALASDEIDGFKVRGIGTGEAIGGQIDGDIRDDKIDDYTAAIGFSVGRRMDHWQTDLSYSYRYRTDWDLAASTPSIETITNVFSDIQAHSLLLNLARRGALNTHWSWEVGGGIGFASKSIESDYIERATADTAQVRFAAQRDQTELIYNAFIGVERSFSHPWSLGIRLRYVDMGGLEAGPFPGRDARISADHQMIELRFLLRRHW